MAVLDTLDVFSTSLMNLSCLYLNQMQISIIQTQNEGHYNIFKFILRKFRYNNNSNRATQLLQSSIHTYTHFIHQKRESRITFISFIPECIIK